MHIGLLCLKRNRVTTGAQHLYGKATRLYNDYTASIRLHLFGANDVGHHSAYSTWPSSELLLVIRTVCCWPPSHMKNGVVDVAAVSQVEVLWRQKGWAPDVRAEFVQRIRQHPQLASRCIDVLYGLRAEQVTSGRVRLPWTGYETGTRLATAVRTL